LLVFAGRLLFPLLGQQVLIRVDLRQWRMRAWPACIFLPVCSSANRF
jgi:hypothetical protein